jgi:hypothetical protein
VINNNGYENYDLHSYVNGTVKLVKGRIIDTKLNDYQNGSVIVEGEGSFSIKSVVYDRSTLDSVTELQNSENIAIGKYSVCFGQKNKATNDNATVSGGYNNKASVYTSVIIGGANNIAQN